MDKAIFRSQVNGLKFDSYNPTTNHLLNSHQKSQFVQAETPTTKSTRKAKVSIGTDDVEQELN
ncbi:hypothetical protein ACLSZP_09705 [Avibacterium avium]|uniref:hypothetical protein n=1 Tax=Avibacterium TaxID=292486 RepID=UPI0039FCCD61